MEEARRILFRILKKNPIYIFGLAVVTLFLAFSLVVGLFPQVLGYNPLQLDLSHQLLPPSLKFPFGTDDLGRNIFLKVLYGAPIDAGVSIVIIAASLLVGIPIGAIAGYFGGAVDELFMRTTDIFLAFPGLIFVVAIAAALGPGLENAVLAIGVVWWPIYTRLSRGETISIKERQYVMAAQAAGVSRTRIVFEHIVPNIINPLIAYATADVGNVIILFSVLGYLGLGAQPPRVDIGRIVYDGQTYLQIAPWYPILPGLVLFIIVLSFAFVGDMLRDYLDPRNRV